MESEAGGQWEHVTDGTPCPEQFPLGHQFATRAMASDDKPWWCTTHQSALRWVESADRAMETDPMTWAWCEQHLMDMPVVEVFHDQIGYEERAQPVIVTRLDCGDEIVVVDHGRP